MEHASAAQESLDQGTVAGSLYMVTDDGSIVCFRGG